MDRFELIQLQEAEVLHTADCYISHVYFPVGGYVAFLKQQRCGAPLEIGSVGAEGMVGSQLAIGVAEAPFDAVVQCAGFAYRMPLMDFERALVDMPDLKRCVHRYLYVEIILLAAASACRHLHSVPQRLARWLLTASDRAGADTFSTSQETIARCLGVRRSGISVAAGELQHRGLIRYTRGSILLVQRAQLEKCACECYNDNRRTYANQFPVSVT